MTLALLSLLGCEPTTGKVPGVVDSALDTASPQDSQPSDDPDAAIEPVPGTDLDDEGCPTLYQQDRLPVFELEITEEDWAALEADYSTGVEQYHPTTFLYRNASGGELRVEDASVRLRGNPGFSWIGEKMQFGIAFNEEDPEGRFLGLRHLSLDAVWYEPSMLRDRLAYAYLRRLGVPAPCANNAELWVNGAYYGLYKNVEYPDREWVERVFGDEDATGVLWKYGSDPTVNAESADAAHMAEFWANTSVAWQEAHTDLDANVLEWAGEVVLPQNDGYWCCNHNFYLYEHPTRGILFLPWDMDFAFDDTPYFADPNTFYRDSNYQPHLDAVSADATWGPVFLSALREAVDAYDPDLMQGWLDEWQAQIAASHAADPHTPHSVQTQQDAYERLRAYLRNRHAWMDAWVRCREGEGDGDGDGVSPCSDCDDADASIYPGATETCDGRDTDCDGLVDDALGCDTCDAYSFESGEFRLCTTPMSWEDAQAACEAEGGELGFPLSSGEWYVYWLHQYWQELAWLGVSTWWLGATDAASEGTWLTPSGEPASPWASWGAGTPNGGASEQCAMTSPYTWTWDDADCALEKPAFCRVELGP